MIRHIPMVAFQTALYKLLTEKQTTPVYDDVPSKMTPPAITFGTFVSTMGGAKQVDISEVKIYLDLWSEYEGKMEINTIAEEVSAVYTAWDLDLSESGYRVISKDIVEFNAYPEEKTGYHGVLTLTAEIQYIGGNKNVNGIA